METGKLIYGILAGIFGVVVQCWRNGKAKQKEAKEGAEKFTWKGYLKQDWPVYVANLALVAVAGFRFVIPADYTLIKWEWLSKLLYDARVLVHTFPGFSFFSIGYMGNDIAMLIMGKTSAYIKGLIKHKTDPEKI